MLRHGQYYRTRRQPSDRSAQRQLWLLDQYRSRCESRLFPASFTRPFWGQVHAYSIRRFISLTTQWISASVVLKLVIQARMTGVSPIRASDIHAIWRWWRPPRNLAGTSPSRVKQTSGNGVELTMRQPEALNASRSTCPIQVWCSIISAYRQPGQRRGQLPGILRSNDQVCRRNDVDAVGQRRAGQIGVEQRNDAA